MLHKKIVSRVKMPGGRKSLLMCSFCGNMYAKYRIYKDFAMCLSCGSKTYFIHQHKKKGCKYY